MYAIMEYKGRPHETDSYSPPGNRRTPHTDDVRIVACHSYIEACDDPFGPDAPFQFHLGVRYPTGQFVPFEQQRNSRQQIEKILRELPATVKIVSISYGGGTPAGLLGADMPFASIAAAGNEDRETFLPPGFPENEGLRRIRAAVAADKVLYVSGYNAVKAAEEGIYERDGVTGCIGEGFSEGCIWAPAWFGYPYYARDEDRIVDFGGTSASAPHVASALASVLAVFPETTPQNLIRVAKACAIPTPSLPGGVGRADFTCMTKMGSDGQWRVLSANEFAGLISPDRMNHLVFPGDARVSGTFVPASGKPVVLATRARSAFSFSAGIPAFSPENHAPGPFPVVAGDGERPALGAGIATDGGLFAAASLGSRDGFFGLGGRYGYKGARGVDAEAGHRNLYARFSRQWSSAAPLIREIRGDAVGLTAEYAFRLSPETVATLSAHADRFVGGRADTAFGAVRIEGGRWNRSAEARIDSRLSGSESLSLTADWRRLARGGGAAGAAAGYRLAF